MGSPWSFRSMLSSSRLPPLRLMAPSRRSLCRVDPGQEAWADSITGIVHQSPGCLAPSASGRGHSDQELFLARGSVEALEEKFMKPPVSSNNKEPTDAGVEADLKARPHDRPTLEEKFPISGPIGRATGVVSAAARQEAKAIHAMIFGDKATRRRNDAPAQEGSSGNSIGVTAAWQPYADGDSNILVGKKGSVKLDDLLTKALAPIGYIRVAKLTYRANWSTDDVEQFLSFDTYGNPKQYLSSSAGLRNLRAEAFAKQCHERYADKIFFRDMPKGGYVFP